MNKTVPRDTTGHATDVLLDQLPGGVQAEHNLFQSTINPLDVPNPTHSADVFKAATAQLGSLRQSIGHSLDKPSIEERLSALEVNMMRFFEEQRRFMSGVRRDEPDVPTPRRERSRPRSRSPARDQVRTHERHATHPTIDIGANRVHAALNLPQHTRDLMGDRSVPNDSASHYQPYASRSEEHSVLIPYEDLRAARASLPEFTGTRVEDPVRFLTNTESILQQARIHISGWCRAVEPQLKGTAATWWKSIKVLDLSWDEFRVEFLQNFDNDEIRLRLRADILSTPQNSSQTLTEFILQKNQLARRVNTGLSESELVHIIAGLTRESFRTHIRLHRPSTFSELRSIASILDPGTNAPTPPPTREFTPHGKKGVVRLHKGPPVQKPNANFPHRKPPGPCKFCGELHWHNECQHNPTTSGNGGGAGRV
jgi:hypothetical protein